MTADLKTESRAERSALLARCKDWLHKNGVDGPANRAEFLLNFVWREREAVAAEARKDALELATQAIWDARGQNRDGTPDYATLVADIRALAGRKEGT